MRRRWSRVALVALLWAAWPVMAAAQDPGALAEDATESPGIEVQGERWLEPDEILSSLHKLTAPNRRSSALPRFFSPFCPRVAGVDRAVADLMEQRIRENAKFAGLFTEPKRCRLNAFVIVLEEPLEMFDRLRNHRPGLLGIMPFRDKHVETIRIDLKAGKPVVAWNQVGMSRLGADIAMPDFSVFSSREWRIEGAARSKDIAVVLLDKNQLDGFNLTQISDLASIYLIGLPRRHLDFSGVRAPTMLRMFEDGPQSAPPSLTEFDRAYLKGIHVPDRNTLGERIGSKVVAVYREECSRPDGRCDLDDEG